MKHLFIVNPVAGNGQALKYMNQIEKLFTENIKYEIEITKDKGDATEIAKAYTRQEDYIVYAVGGDGTINEVINGIVGTNSVLAVIPAGSGNDLIRTLYPKYSKEGLMLQILNGKPVKMDMMKINNRYFLNIASIGIDAEVAYNARLLKKNKYIKKDMAYILSIFNTLIGYQTTKLHVKVDHLTRADEKILLLAMANGMYYGGGIPIAPSACINDGKINVCMVRDIKMRYILPLIPKLFRGRHERDKHVEVYTGSCIEVESETLFKVNIDGEIVETKQLAIEVVPQGIWVMKPCK